MREQMISEGYVCEGGNWISPYTGEATSFQPARDEFLLVCKLGGIIRNSPMEWLRQVRSQKDRIKNLMERSRKQSTLIAQCTKVVEQARRLLDDIEQGRPPVAKDALRKALEAFDAPAEPEVKVFTPSVPLNLRFFHDNPFPWEDAE